MAPAPSTPVVPLSGSPSIKNDVRSTKPLPYAGKNCGWLNALSSSAENCSRKSPVRDDVLVERRSSRPRCRGPSGCPSWRCRACPAPGMRVGRLIEERIARSAGVRIADLIRPPGAAEEVAQAVERLARVPRAGRVEAAEERRQVLPAARLERSSRPSSRRTARPPTPPCSRRAARPRPTGMSHVAFATTRCLTTFGSGPRSFSMSYGIELDRPDRAVAGIGRVAVGVGQRVGGVEREAAPPAAQQLELRRVELAARRGSPTMSM